MGDIIYVTIEGEHQGDISSGCGTTTSVGNRWQQGHEDEIFVFSLTQGISNTGMGVKHQGLSFSKVIDRASPLLTNAINNNENLKMRFDIYRINRFGRWEKYYVIKLRGARLNRLVSESRQNSLDYEYISLDYDYIHCQHLLAGTEFDYLVTPERYNQLFPVAQVISPPPEPEKRKVTLVLGIFFDGTGNNAVNTRNMLAACTAQHFDIDNPDAERILQKSASEKMGLSGTEATSYYGYYTNIHWLNELYLKRYPPDGHYIQYAVYIEGIGTQAGEADSMIGLGLGTSDYGVIAKTDDAVAQLAEAIKAALDQLHGEFSVDTFLFDIFGFSRGAAAARHFANRVQSEDGAIVNAINAGMVKQVYTGKPAGKTRFMGIFDTVTAVGTPFNGLNPHSADTGDVNIRLRPGVAQKVFHITAQHECRYNFALNSVAPAWPEITLPGVHSDIGGGYLPKTREDLFLTRPQVDTLPSNQPDERSGAYRKTMAQLPVLEASPAIAPIMRTNEITPEVWSDDYAATDRYGQMQKRSFAALTMRQRIVRNDWSKVILRVMVDAAKEAGVMFEPFENKKDIQIPGELLTFYEHATRIGKSARLRQPAIGFSGQDIEIIAKTYIHCSANWNAVTVSKTGKPQGGVSASETIGFVNRPDVGWLRTVYNMDGKQ